MPVRIVVISAPSGAGKTTLAQCLLEELPQLSFAKSVTTRPPRKGEVHGEDYFFVSPPEFDRMRREDELLEYEEVYPGQFYGTPKSEADRASVEQPLLLDIDVHGAIRVAEHYHQDAFTVFICPPDMESLEARLRARGTETPASLRQRMDRARHEMRHQDRFDAVIINDDLDESASKLVSLVSARIA